MVLRATFLVVLWLFAQLSARASVDMFLQITGVPGESRDSAHANQIDVLAWSWGMSNSGTVSGGGTGGGRVSIQDLSVTKYVDKASPALMLGCSKGTHYDTVKLSFRRAGAARATDHFMVITMEQVIVTSLSTGGSGGEDRFTENVSFNFGKVTVAYWEQRPDGTLVAVTPYTWNVAANTE